MSIFRGELQLAYSWDNLFLSCQLCNQRFKRECFPLRIQKQRAHSHKHDLTREEPLLINPSGSPERHLTFVGEMAVPHKRSQQGRETIEVLGLNRAELLEHRLERRRFLLALRESLRHLQVVPNPSTAILQHIGHMQTLLDNAIADEAEYATMARVLLR